MGRKLHPKTQKLGFTSPRVNKHLASKKGFRQKRNVFLSVPLRSTPLFLEVPAKKEHSFFFFNPGSCGFWGILEIPAGMHNLAEDKAVALAAYFLFLM
jgi:hypothetical protein